MKNKGRSIAIAFLQFNCAMFCLFGSTAYGSTAFESSNCETIRDSRCASIGQIGVSLAGAEFGDQRKWFSNKNSGKFNVDYIFPGDETIRFFANHDVDFFRLPILWERVQPQLSQPLDPFYLNKIIKFCDQSHRRGIKVIIDLHNYGRYRLHEGDQSRTFVIDQVVENKTPVSRADFADVWKRLAQELTNHPAVIGYGLMNEPHTMGNSNWKAISQNAVSAIRSVDKETHILIAGEHWSSAEKFTSSNGSRAWIDDPSKRIIYEAHLYFDHDSSGRYQRSFESELKKDRRMLERAQDRLQPFLKWCKETNSHGIIGEVGCPANANWKPLLEHTINSCLKENIPVCYWAAGPWWGDYRLSVQPAENQTDTQRSNQLAPQWRWLVNAKKNANKLLLHAGSRHNSERNR